ncbi:MAG: RagB/SusD family nutrient uptake outer membrane protein [Bacteroidales bacterium]|nr:RagB/SusD family nutrient uptake outer membrane protein [Candidatus Liminaster caballi]
MKTNIFKSLGIVAISSAMLFTSCEDFLDCPAEDGYNSDNYYTSDNACIAGVNYLYNSPWYDFQRGFIKVGEVFSGNMYWGSSPYLNFSVNGTDDDLVNMAYSLWSEIAHCSTVYNSLKGATASQAVKDQCMGECLAWKAMAYFFLVRSFGDVPIIHDNTAELASGNYATAQKVQKADVYDYIIMNLEKAMELLPKSSAPGRIDYYCAEALLAKVYLTKAGVSGSLNSEDLQLAAKYAKDVIDNSGRTLTENYEDIFRGSHNNDPESLFAWRWTVGAHWTCQNTLQSDLGIVGFDEYGDVWGGWGGPSSDLMAAFGVIKFDHTVNSEGKDSVYIASFPSPDNRLDNDVRRKGTMMLPGDVYSYFWRDKGGFDYLRAIYDTETEYGKTFSEGQCQGPCGCNNVKHLYGDDADHVAELGISAARMAHANATHILRLADIYLIYAEAMLLDGKGGDASALDAFNAVRTRAHVPTVAALDFDLIWKERRLEFAGEGDRWYDFVRRSYYDADACLAEIKSQFRNNIWGCNLFYKTYYESGQWPADLTYLDDNGNLAYLSYNNSIPVPENITKTVFTMPFPTEDCAINPNLKSEAEPIHVDVRSTYSY